MRLIPRLDIKNDFVIKGINLEGLRKIGKPLDLLEKYYKEGKLTKYQYGVQLDVILKELNKKK
jgi:imidazole glycerol phosphate synthase subunit HisF